MHATDRRSGLALVICIAAFCVAMGLRELVNVWVGTGSAALVSLAILSAMSGFSSLYGDTGLLQSVAWGVLIGLAMSIATWVLYPISVELIPSIGLEVERLYALLRQPPGPLRALPVLVFVVAAEELVWRGLAMDVFSRLGAFRAVLVASVAYILPQVAFRSGLLVVVALLCGIVWSTLRVRTRGVLAPFVAHLVWDLLVFVMYPVA